MRLSQAHFAEAVRAAGNAIGAPNHCTKRLVQKWETGEHAACRADYLRVLQAVTGLSARELGFRLLPDQSGQSAVGFGDAGEGAAGNSSGADAAGSAAAAFARSRTTGYDPDAAIAESMDRMRHALEHPSVVDMRTAEFVKTATSRMFDLERHSPARLLAPTAERHLTTVTALLTVARHEKVRHDLMLSAGHSALLAAWLAFDRGDNPSAHRFWDSAIGAAESTGDAALLAASLTFQSYAAARRGDPHTAWQLAHDASRHTLHDDRATAWTASRVALYAAQLGEREAADAAIRQALDLGANLPHPKPGDGTMPWLRSFDYAQLFSSIAHATALLNDPHATGYATWAVNALSPAKVKSRAVVLAEAALVAATTNELDLCLDYGSAAARQPRSPASWTSALPPTYSTRSSPSSCPTPTRAPSENYCHSSPA